MDVPFLPNEMLNEIFVHCEPQTMLRVCLVCRGWLGFPRVVQCRKDVREIRHKLTRAMLEFTVFGLNWKIHPAYFVANAIKRATEWWSPTDEWIKMCFMWFREVPTHVPFLVGLMVCSIFPDVKIREDEKYFQFQAHYLQFCYGFPEEDRVFPMEEWIVLCRKITRKWQEIEVARFYFLQKQLDMNMKKRDLERLMEFAMEREDEYWQDFADDRDFWFGTFETVMIRGRGFIDDV